MIAKHYNIVALTGGIACGKTQVSNTFAQLGVAVEDADVIARQLVQPGESALEDIVATFGKAVLLENGQLNRPLLRQQIFGDVVKKQQLEQILHPRIRQKMLQNIAHLNSVYCIFSVPLLIETRHNQDALIRQAQRVLVVDCPESLQRQRVQQRDNLDAGIISNILAAQCQRQTRLAYADDVIHNNTTLSELHKKVEKLHQFYLKNFHHPMP
ncbi:dephospho-CoA kinase [Candidatus Venteria ishoeyi]|uniref:dephospho-CoA kinase n=1 Tax=Candidatus Venteria ishoeyi TaxID=1899563 RepID=UPI0025A67F74|nr:dephospho-CoA kinase [Candidatus Venteria ishoeyi]MDM8547197.1 dephospho-CoA kinase [Candidatus Venteria ishoeyi]